MSPTDEPRDLLGRLRRMVVGRPRDLSDRSLAQRIALVPLLAWVGLGADGLSSSAYGPEESLRALGDHAYLAIPLAAMVALTVFVISACYSRIIEQFPQGGGGYTVTSALLGKHAGLVAGCALLIDYVLTISVSIAAAGAALFSFLPPTWAPWKLLIELGLIGFLVLLNLRGVRESMLVLAPIFALFALTHLVTIIGGTASHLHLLPETMERCTSDFDEGLSVLGVGGILALFVHAYSLGGGTYTGIEAVSNGLPVMREPRVETGKRTMLYMALSLAFTAGGLMLCYLLWNASPQAGKTLNAVLLENMTANVPLGGAFAAVTLVSEGALLVVAAQTGFIGGPRVLASMSLDSWAPRAFASLSERLTTRNGILLMGAAAVITLVYTGGVVHQLVVMYSINVFITFSLAIFGMLRFSLRSRRGEGSQAKATILFAVGFVLCVTILVVTIIEKFGEGGWITLVVTSGVVGWCLLINAHYQAVGERLSRLTSQVARLPTEPKPNLPAFDPKLATAGILVGEYGGVGLHTTMNIFRAFPDHFRNLVFIAVGVVDTGEFKGEFAAENLQQRTEGMLDRYVTLAHSLGLPAVRRLAIGTDVVDEAVELCEQVAKEFPRITFFAGKVVFEREGWFERFLHNRTAFAIQRRLHWSGRIMVILPVRVR